MFMYVRIVQPPLSNTTYPCLLSSSGSGPGELEHGAQLLPANEDFILRARETKTQFQHPRTVPLSYGSACINISDCTKTMTKQDAGGCFNTKQFFFPISMSQLVLFFIFI